MFWLPGWVIFRGSPHRNAEAKCLHRTDESEELLNQHLESTNDLAFFLPYFAGGLPYAASVRVNNQKRKQRQQKSIDVKLQLM